MKENKMEPKWNQLEATYSGFRHVVAGDLVMLPFGCHRAQVFERWRCRLVGVRSGGRDRDVRRMEGTATRVNPDAQKSQARGKPVEPAGA